MQKEWLWVKEEENRNQITYRYVECEISDRGIIPNWARDSGASIVHYPGAFPRNRYRWSYRGNTGKASDLKEAQADCYHAMGLSIGGVFTVLE